MMLCAVCEKNEATRELLAPKPSRPVCKECADRLQENGAAIGVLIAHVPLALNVLALVVGLVVGGAACGSVSTAAATGDAGNSPDAAVNPDAVTAGAGGDSRGASGAGGAAATGGSSGTTGAAGAAAGSSGTSGAAGADVGGRGGGAGQGGAGGKACMTTATTGCADGGVCAFSTGQLPCSQCGGDTSHVQCGTAGGWCCLTNPPGPGGLPYCAAEVSCNVN